jgi:hypothetical protein
MTLNRLVATRAITVPLSALAAAQAHAHDGHGLTGSHWHASDAWGFVAFAALVAVAVWLSRNDK